MRIEAVSAQLVSLPMARPMQTAIHRVDRTENVLVEITAGGRVGQGAALTLAIKQAGAVACMVDDLAEGLVGEDARNVRGHWARLWGRLNFTGQSGIGVLALSAIDTALWDLLALEAGMPLYRLLGAVHEELPVYSQGGWLSYSVEELVEEALALQEKGFSHYKMRAGSAHWREDVERVERVRAALDDDTELLVDANQGWSTAEALAAARSLDGLRLYWLEEPVDVGNVEGSARVAAATTTPISAGETVFGTAGFAPLIERRAADVLMPDLQHCGGPTGFMRVAEQAALANLPISSHLFTEVSVHLLAACPNALIVEHMPGWWDDLFDGGPQIVDGRIRPPQEPGLGCRFSERARRQFAVRPKLPAVH